MIVVSLVVWAGVIVFVLAAAAKMIRYAKMPMHLRWELYPVPHEAGRGHYGGSSMEEVDWWTKKTEVDHGGEAKAMGEEIFLLKGVYEANRPLWLWSWLLHGGLYLLVATIGLLFVGALVENITGAALTGGAAFWRFVAVLTRWVCWIGLVAAAFGTLGLLIMRLNSPKLKSFNSPFTILNLLFMLLLFAMGICSRFNGDADVSLLRATLAGVMTFGTPAMPLTWQVQAELIGFAVFATYMPFTFMSHMYMKFFTYHKVRWDDHARRPGDTTDPRLAEYLNWHVGWSAPHVTRDGQHKTWADVVMDQEVEK